MKTKILIAVLSIGLFTMSTVKAQEKTKMKVEKAAYACPMQCEGEKTYDKESSCPKCKMDLKKVDMKMAEMYACPMHCEGEKTYDKAGSCPKCKMDLKKVDMKMDPSKMKMDQCKMEMGKACTCPMHDAVKSEKTCTCPKCAMDSKKMEMKKE